MNKECKFCVSNDEKSLKKQINFILTQINETIHKYINKMNTRPLTDGENNVILLHQVMFDDFSVNKVL